MENIHVSSVAAGVRPAAATRPKAWKWASAFGLSLIFAGVGAFLVAIMTAGGDPSGLAFVIPIMVIAAAVAWAVVTRGRWAQGLALVAALAMVALLGPAIPHATIDSFFDFVPVIAALGGAVITFAAAVADLARRPAGQPLTRGLTIGGGGVVAGLVVLSAVSGIATYAGQETLSEAERAGLVQVGMKDVKFLPARLTATEGETVSIALKNSDPVIHDLRIKDLDLKFTVKPGSEKAFSFTAPGAGTYAFDCSLHPNMKGVLEVLPRQ